VDRANITINVGLIVNQFYRFGPLLLLFDDGHVVDSVQSQYLLLL
jgi:hypothetical protein